MDKYIADCNMLNLPHDQMVKLRKAGQLNLGINNQLAAQISAARAGSKKTTASAAHTFWRLVALGVLTFGAYQAYTSHGWWLVVGIIGAIVISKANEQGNAENVLDAAMIDPEFYERVRKINGWRYEIADTEFHKIRAAMSNQASHSSI